MFEKKLESESVNFCSVGGYPGEVTVGNAADCPMMCSGTFILFPIREYSNNSIYRTRRVQ